MPIISNCTLAFDT